MKKKDFLRYLKESGVGLAILYIVSVMVSIYGLFTYNNPLVITGIIVMVSIGILILICWIYNDYMGWKHA